MSPSSVVEIKAFVPAIDLAVSRAFYEEIGFAINWDGGDIAYCQADGASFLLQRLEHANHAVNTRMHLLVSDADAWHRHILAARIAQRYAVYVGAIEDRPWAIRDFTLTDPSGVLWRIGHNLVP